ncbi:unnamed protein product [Adineta steineri]|uniref:Multifunctional fusion protein n=2 Tax=Adineta steineri TaxID=433720 RepID=A0A814JH42_9BILA|nr:unnamed protein product [Adineta steineri]
MPQQIMPFINDIPQLDSVYIFSSIKSLREEHTKKWQKVRSVNTNINDLCKALQSGIKKYNQNSIAMSFITVNEMASIDNLNQLEPTFMYSQLLNEILVTMEHNKQAIKDFITYCRQNDCVSLTILDQFEKEYQAQLAIWWYTFPSNIYSMLNYGLRILDADIVITMRFFLHDLHQQIQQLYEEQISTYDKQPFVVYRGQGLMKSDFEKLQRTQGSLMSFNNFLSTSTSQEISFKFAEAVLENRDMVGIIFVMAIDPCIKSAPFASIKEVSYYKEEDEILFSMHTIFRVIAIKPIRNKNELYQVELQLTSDDDQQLRLLTDRIRQEAGGGTGWQILGNLLLKIGQFNKAEELYNVLLEQTPDKDEKTLYYNQLGGVHWNQGDYKKAIWYFEQTLEIYQKTLRSDHPHLGNLYNNIGNIYDKMGEYSKALSFYEKALQIQQKTLPVNHSDPGALYNNIADVYCNMGEYSKALLSHEKAIEIIQKTLPSNHPSLALSYNNIAGLYYSIGEYSKAQSFYEKALKIWQKTLPSNHPNFGTLYNNIGLVYYNMGEYSKALSSHEKALEIWQKILSSNHPSLAMSYNNIGLVCDTMGEYSKALSFNEKALEIYQKILPSNHPSLGTIYNNIGLVYYNMGEYSKALSFYEKALEIFQKALPPNHPHLATSYNNIADLYCKKGEYSKVLSYYEKALDIRQKTLSSNHPELPASYNNVGSVYAIMGKYSKALPYYESALDLLQRALPPTHPHIEAVKQSIEIVKKKL